MRCPTCGESSHPGYIAWRGRAVGPSAFRGALLPCPDCGGSAIVSGCEGWPRELGGSRPYRAYFLDERGMIVLAEIITADGDDAATEAAVARLDEESASAAIEVWDKGRCVHAQRREAERRPPPRPPLRDGFLERLW